MEGYKSKEYFKNSAWKLRFLAQVRQKKKCWRHNMWEKDKYVVYSSELLTSVPKTDYKL